MHRKGFDLAGLSVPLIVDSRNCAAVDGAGCFGGPYDAQRVNFAAGH
jgi:hypothetical protein